MFEEIKIIAWPVVYGLWKNSYIACLLAGEESSSPVACGGGRVSAWQIDSHKTEP